jgi:orotidine-5'-phosphate decarboxylase
LNKNIFVALDFDNLDLALETTKKIRDEIAGVKVGTELYTICGNEGLKKLKELGVDIFLDLKLGPEIPNQVKKTISALETLKTIKYLTIHTSGDYEMLNSAKEAAVSIELLGVTVLTSQSNLQNLGIKNSIKDQVKILVELANKSKLAGVISSAQDLSLVRSISKNLKIFCPGIRGQNDKMNDQKRVMSYADFTKTADSKCFAVIGRPIIEGDPVQNIKKIIQSSY